MSMNAVRRVAANDMTDTIDWTNDTGSATVNNQMVFISGATNRGLVGICQGPIANGAVGVVLIKGEVELPLANVAMVQGRCAQASTSATSMTTAGTASGLFAVGMVRDTVASSVGYVKVDLNYGPDAFYTW